MAGPNTDDRDEIDRAFAELVAGYGQTADRSGSSDAPPSAERPGSSKDSSRPGAADAPDHSTSPPGPVPASVSPVVFRFEPPAPPPDQGEVDERYVPEALPPLRRPGPTALLGWSGVIFACLVTLVTAFGVRAPAWVGWLAVGSFIAGFAVLLTRLPRHRPPDAGNGAVL